VAAWGTGPLLIYLRRWAAAPDVARTQPLEGHEKTTDADSQLSRTGGRVIRPAPGTQTTSEYRVPICVNCGCVIGDIGCSYRCSTDYDLAEREPGDYIIAVYRRVDTFLRDEPGGAA
jgi:hypothetical protein